MFASTPQFLAAFTLCLVVPTVLLVSAAALFYFRRVRIERPPIGTFNARDITILFIMVNLIPLFYLQLPRYVLSGFLALTFMASLSIGFQTLLNPWALWGGIGGLLGLNIWLGNNALGTIAGWQVFWLENDILVFLGAISVANLYIQGGMRMRHVAWFGLVLSVYDSIFISVFPVTNEMVQAFLGYPLDPEVGFRIGMTNAAIGIGDLFVYSLFILAAYKAYGKVAFRVALAVTVVFGAIVPATIPLVIDYVDARRDTMVPAQLWFGPMAFLAYLWMKRRYGRERTMQEYLASDDAYRRRAHDAPTSPAPAFVLREEQDAAKV